MDTAVPSEEVWSGMIGYDWVWQQGGCLSLFSKYLDSIWYCEKHPKDCCKTLCLKYIYICEILGTRNRWWLNNNFFLFLWSSRMGNTYHMIFPDRLLVWRQRWRHHSWQLSMLMCVCLRMGCIILYPSSSHVRRKQWFNHWIRRSRYPMFRQTQTIPFWMKGSSLRGNPNSSHHRGKSFWKLPDPKRSCPNGHRSNNNSSSMCIPVGMCLISTWRFPKVAVPPNHPFKYRIFHFGVPPGNLHIATNFWLGCTDCCWVPARVAKLREAQVAVPGTCCDACMILDVQRWVRSVFLL